MTDQPAAWLNFYRYLHDRSHYGPTRFASREEADASRRAYFERAREMEPQGLIIGYDLEAGEVAGMWFFDAKRVRGMSFCWAKDCTESRAEPVL
ncbi:hypothetical protein [Aureimonas psammosilenae]|uniref:hypothetical protein n=1 Tax=Aureimonas psammosilenae TaxID=2495496 RepID=UPI0012609B4A|nr:hypothetical protein [Aureimonas psammosilenae]